MLQLKRQRFGKVNQSILIPKVSKEDLEKIQSAYKPSSSDPKSLQQVVWFKFMFQLIRRGTKESVALQVDVAGKKFVYQVVDKLDKNHRAEWSTR